MYDMKGFGERIAVLRKNKNMTQDELAQRLGVTSQAVSKWENSLSYPDIEIIPTICSILEVSLDDIFGKVKQDVSNLSFPPVFKGANMVGTFANVACYSDKEINKRDGSTITFKDGSIAELQSRRVANRGAGKILLKTIDDSYVAEDIADTSARSGGFLGIFKKASLTQTNLHLEYGEIENLDCRIANSDCIISKSESGITVIDAQGVPEFIDMLQFDYDGSLLKIYYDNDKANKIDWNKLDAKNNKISVMLECDYNKTNTANLGIHGAGDIKLNVKFRKSNMAVHGSGDIDAPVSFEEANIAVHGSGDIEFNDADYCNIAVHGSGDVKFNNSGNCSAGIHGSGDIKCNDIGNLNLQIHGSGSIALNNSDNISVNIHGSGDLTANNVTASVSAQTHGSGDIDIKSGEIQMFDISLSGGGNIKAKNVTTDRAKIKVKGGGKVEIGRVKIESIEEYNDDADVTIHQRG
ncbi:MAG: DUF2807 domain-containing protein [Oscillospiraceae bacterium]|nr:DUF2807 domain-containing protein [Oscillospiraceae bacterium]